jgi:hypothetical protein
MGMKPRAQEPATNVGINIEAGPDPEGVRAVGDTIDRILQSGQDQMTKVAALQAFSEIVQATSRTNATITNNVIRMGDDEGN